MGYARWSAVAARYHQRSTAAAVSGDERRVVGTAKQLTKMDDERRSHVADVVARRGRFRAVDCVREYRELAPRTRVRHGGRKLRYAPRSELVAGA